jgi:hypothetical protein
MPRDSHLNDALTYLMANDREIFLPNQAGEVERGCHAENWARAEVMQDIVERLEAEGATVVRKKGVIVAVFDED